MSQWKRSFRRKLAKSQNGLVNQNKPVDSQYIQGVAVKLKSAGLYRTGVVAGYGYLTGFL